MQTARMHRVGRDVDEVLKAIAEPGSPNLFTADDVRAWLVALLDDYEAEYAGRGEELRGKVMWDVIAADGDVARDALFVGACLDVEWVDLVAGRGASAAVRRFGDDEFPDDAARLADALTTRFPCSRRLVFSRADVEAWLGRS